ncbi:transposase-like protein [Geodermatophilus bullaregiensis]|nr:transposase [Geodermatophilus bullaregiensis]MBM7808088.1 transposase-like protein [Geodermatophilus bullaregiensis]
MPEQRRKFSPQFKAEAVQMVLETGKPIAEVARDLGINEGTLGMGAYLAPRESGAVDGINSGGACACEGNGRRNPPAAAGERVPKKGGGLLRADATVAERCALIHAEKDTYDITFMCRFMGVPRSTYYAWTNRAETPTQARRRALAVEVAAEFKASRQTSGCRRIAAALNRKGIACSVGLVADLMRELGLAAVQPRAYKRTTVPGDAAKLRSTRSAEIGSGVGRRQRGRPVTPWMPARAMSSSTVPCPTTRPRPRVSSACTRRVP